MPKSTSMLLIWGWGGEMRRVKGWHVVHGSGVGVQKAELNMPMHGRTLDDRQREHTTQMTRQAWEMVWNTDEASCEEDDNERMSQKQVRTETCTQKRSFAGA